VAATNAIFASVNVALLQNAELCRTLQKVVRVVARSDVTSSEMRRAVFASIAATFDRIRENSDGRDRLVDFDGTELKTLLFGTFPSVEASRLLRADALLAISKASLAVWKQIEKDVGLLTAEEVSPVVRERLRQTEARKPAQ
jgi:hypothetical protein